jgi:hypothetical protein
LAIGMTILASIAGHLGLFFWVQRLRARLLALEEAAEADA